MTAARPAGTGKLGVHPAWSPPVRPCPIPVGAQLPAQSSISRRALT